MPRKMTSHRRRLPSVSVDDPNASEEEDEETLVVLSDDTDSEDDHCSEILFEHAEDGGFHHPNP